jgi:hypothetical protein
MLRRDSRWAGFTQLSMNDPALAAELVNEANSLLEESQEVQLGKTVLGPILCNFIHQLIEWAQATQPDAIYFMAREGLLFKRLYDQLAPKLMKGKLIPSTYVCVSRFSTSCWPPNTLSLRDLQSVRLNNEKTTLGILLKAVGYPAHLQGELAQAYGFYSLDEEIQPYDDPAVQALSLDPRLQAHLKQLRATQREGLLNHLKERRLLDCKRVAMVDIGWGGQIQENVHYALQSLKQQNPAVDLPEVHGFYLGLNSLASRRQQIGLSMTSSTLGNMMDYDWLQGALLEILPLWETVAQALHGSTQGYEGPEGRPTFSKQYAADSISDELIRVTRIQEGLLQAAVSYGERVEHLGWSASDCEPYAQLLIARLKRFPRVAEAQVINQLPYSSNLGGEEAQALCQSSGQASFSTLKRALTQRNIAWREGVAAFAGPLFHSLLILKKAKMGLYHYGSSPQHAQFLPAALKRPSASPAIAPRLQAGGEGASLQISTPALPVEQTAVALHQTLIQRATPLPLPVQPKPALTLSETLYVVLLGRAAVALTRRSFGAETPAKFKSWVPWAHLLLRGLCVRFPALFIAVLQLRQQSNRQRFTQSVGAWLRDKSEAQDHSTLITVTTPSLRSMSTKPSVS